MGYVRYDSEAARISDERRVCRPRLPPRPCPSRFGCRISFCRSVPQEGARSSETKRRGGGRAAHAATTTRRRPRWSASDAARRPTSRKWRPLCASVIPVSSTRSPCAVTHRRACSRRCTRYRFESSATSSWCPRRWGARRHAPIWGARRHAPRPRLPPRPCPSRTLPSARAGALR